MIILSALDFANFECLQESVNHVELDFANDSVLFWFVDVVCSDRHKYMVRLMSICSCILYYFLCFYFVFVLFLLLLCL